MERRFVFTLFVCLTNRLSHLFLKSLVALASAFNNTDKIRDRIYSELHNNIILNYGIMDTGARMGALLCLLHDLNVSFKKRL